MVQCFDGNNQSNKDQKGMKVYGKLLNIYTFRIVKDLIDSDILRHRLNSTNPERSVRIKAELTKSGSMKIGCQSGIN